MHRVLYLHLGGLGVFDGLRALWYHCVKSAFNESGYLSGSGLQGEPDCMITVDCCTLMADLSHRISTGFSIEELMSDLHYGVMVEIEMFATTLIDRLQRLLEGAMSQSIGPNNSPEPATIRPS